MTHLPLALIRGRLYKNQGQIWTNILIILSEDQKDSPTELAFKYAVYRINKGREVLPNHTLVYDIQYVPREDSFRTTKKVRYVMIAFICLFLSRFPQP